MIDVHTHILFGVDDGMANIDESIEALREASKVGFKKVVLTPHYIEDTEYSNIYKNNLTRFELLKKAIKKENIDIEIILGNEIYSSINIDEKIKDNTITTIGKTKYVLIEFSQFASSRTIEDQVHNLLIEGYIPIVAHIERYSATYDDYSLVDSLIDMGAVIQVNAYSFLKKYGKNPYKLAKRLLKEDKIHILSTDCHNIAQYTNLHLVEKKVNKLKKDSFKTLFKDNVEKLNLK